jgi:hypothetical protein
VSTIRPAAASGISQARLSQQGSTRAMKNGSSFLKLTNDNVTPSIPIPLIREQKVPIVVALVGLGI